MGTFRKRGKWEGNAASQTEGGKKKAMVKIKNISARGRMEEKRRGTGNRGRGTSPKMKREPKRK